MGNKLINVSLQTRNFFLKLIHNLVFKFHEDQEEVVTEEMEEEEKRTQGVEE